MSNKPDLTNDKECSVFKSNILHDPIHKIQVIKLISNFFLVSDLLHSLQAIQNKGKTDDQNFYNTLTNLRNSILSGDWDKSIELVIELTELQSENSEILINLLSHMIHEQHYLELMNNDQIDEAVSLLRSKLVVYRQSIFSTTRSVESLCQILVENEKEKWQEQLEWSGNVVQSRQELLNNMRFLFHVFTDTGIAPHRLSDLLDLGKKEQSSRCVHHTCHNYQATTAYDYIDSHDCQGYSFPSQSTESHHEWPFYQCSFSPYGKFLATIASIKSGTFILVLFNNSLLDDGEHEENNQINDNRLKCKWKVYKTATFEECSANPKELEIHWRYDGLRLIVTSHNELFIFSIPSLAVQQVTRPLLEENGQSIMRIAPKTDLMIFACEGGHVRILTTQCLPVRIRGDAAFRAKHMALHLSSEMSPNYLRIYVVDYSKRIRVITWHLNDHVLHRMSERILDEQQHDQEEEEAEDAIDVDGTTSLWNYNNKETLNNCECDGENNQGIIPPDLQLSDESFVSLQEDETTTVVDGGGAVGGRDGPSYSGGNDRNGQQSVGESSHHHHHAGLQSNQIRSNSHNRTSTSSQNLNEAEHFLLHVSNRDEAETCPWRQCPLPLPIYPGGNPLFNQNRHSQRIYPLPRTSNPMATTTGAAMQISPPTTLVSPTVGLGMHIGSVAINTPATAYSPLLHHINANVIHRATTSSNSGSNLRISTGMPPNSSILSPIYSLNPMTMGRGLGLRTLALPSASYSYTEVSPSTTAATLLRVANSLQLTGIMANTSATVPVIANPSAGLHLPNFLPFGSLYSPSGGATLSSLRPSPPIITAAAAANVTSFWPHHQTFHRLPIHMNQAQMHVSPSPPTLSRGSNTASFNAIGRNVRNFGLLSPGPITAWFETSLSGGHSGNVIVSPTLSSSLRSADNVHHHHHPPPPPPPHSSSSTLLLSSRVHHLINTATSIPNNNNINRPNTSPDRDLPINNQGDAARLRNNRSFVLPSQSAEEVEPQLDETSVNNLSDHSEDVLNALNSDSPPSATEIFQTPDDVLDLQVSADGLFLFTLHHRCIRVWSAYTGNLLRDLLPSRASSPLLSDTHDNEDYPIFNAQTLTFCGRRSEYVAAITNEDRILIWRTNCSKPIHEVNVNHHRSKCLDQSFWSPICIALHPLDPSILAMINCDQSLHFWSPSSST